MNSETLQHSQIGRHDDNIKYSPRKCARTGKNPSTGIKAENNGIDFETAVRKAVERTIDREG